MNEIQTFYTYLRSQQAARDYLLHCYQQIDDPDADTKSYENSQAFLYYLDHGLRLYNTGKNAEVFVRPILYFYGMAHLLKACLLAKRPNYPESASLMAHGVSTRKKKKKNYSFLDDEVKVQVNGLFPYFTEHLYSRQLLHFEKISMKQLLVLIPEMNQLFSFYDKQPPAIVIGSVTSNILLFPVSILDRYQVEEKTFLRRIKPYLPQLEKSDNNSSALKLYLTGKLEDESGPFFIHGKSGEIYFPNCRNYYFPIAEGMVHYLLLYNLSMLCRYETEWWGDLFAAKSEKDYSFIVHFLTVTAEKVPTMLGRKLLENFSPSFS